MLHAGRLTGLFVIAIVNTGDRQSIDCSILTAGNLHPLSIMIMIVIMITCDFDTCGANY